MNYIMYIIYYIILWIKIICRSKSIFGAIIGITIRSKLELRSQVIRVMIGEPPLDYKSFIGEAMLREKQQLLDEELKKKKAVLVACGYDYRSLFHATRDYKCHKALASRRKPPRRSSKKRRQRPFGACAC